MSTIPSYVISDNLPAPVTSGTTIQSFVDVWGDMWVAKNGVNSGNWLRARDVLNAKYSRNATLTTIAGGWNAVAFDTAAYDAYGIYASSNFTAPVAGMYLLLFNFSVSTTTTNQTVGLTIGGSLSFQATFQLTAPTAALQRLQTSDIVKLNAGQYVNFAYSTPVAMTASTGVSMTAASFTYLGTG